MTEFVDLLVAVALLTLAYGLVSRLAERTVVTAPMVVVAAGMTGDPEVTSTDFIKWPEGGPY